MSSVIRMVSGINRYVQIVALPLSSHHRTMFRLRPAPTCAWKACPYSISPAQHSVPSGHSPYKIFFEVSDRTTADMEDHLTERISKFIVVLHPRASMSLISWFKEASNLRLVVCSRESASITSELPYFYPDVKRDRGFDDF